MLCLRKIACLQIKIDIDGWVPGGGRGEVFAYSICQIKIVKIWILRKEKRNMPSKEHKDVCNLPLQNFSVS